jgi:hypothetical protein
MIKNNFSIYLFYIYSSFLLAEKHKIHNNESHFSIYPKSIYHRS